MSRDPRPVARDPLSVREERARLFFALWPAREIQHALGKVARDLRQECGGRAIPPERMHLTLSFLGETRRDRIPLLETLAAGVAAPGGFELAIDHVGYWRHNRIVWAGADQCPPALPLLVERIGQGLASQGIPADPRPGVPHITLLRDARMTAPRRELGTILWPVERYALVESVRRGGGLSYEVLKDWPLGP